MTDNERRAHDLAIASIPLLFTNAQNANTKDVRFDLYDVYMSVYSEALESFNRDFPD